MDGLTPAAGLPLLSDHTRFLRRHAAQIATLMLIGGIVGLGWALLQSRTYSATASIVLTPVPVYLMLSADELVPPEVSIDTTAQLLHNPKVLSAVGEILGEDPTAASDHVSVTASPNSRVLHVSVSADDPAVAADAANTAVAALAQVRRDSLGVLDNQQLRHLKYLADRQDRELAREQSRRAILPGFDEEFTQVVDLRTRVAELEAGRRYPAHVISSAVTPKVADRSNAEVPVVSGVMLGLLAGCLVAIIRERTPSPTDHPMEDRHDA